VTFATGLVLATVLATGPLGLAADSPLDRAEPAARTRFEALAATYAKLDAYRDHGRFRRTIKLGGKSHSDDSPLSTAFTRPNKIAIDAGEVRLLGDGKTLSTILEPTRRFATAPADPKLNPTTIADGPAGAVLLGGATGPPSQLLLKLLLGVEPASALPDRCTALKAEPDAVLAGKPVAVLRLELGDEPALRVLIDPATNLIRRMEYVVDEKSAAERVPKSAGELQSLSIAWDSGEVSTGPIDAEVFAFKPPAGFARLKAAEAKPAAAPAKNEMVGKLAPEFSITVLDGPNKTKTLTRDDLAGKVVILDFWATWCGPCLAELPEIQKLRDSLAKAGKTGVVILAVSQDRAPDDGTPVRLLVEATLKEKAIELADNAIGRVAIDPDQTMGDAFKVQALPTLVILDAKGIVQAVHVVFRDDIKDTLATEIDALLEGKDLAPVEAPNPAKD